jgi:hypothetical protein
MRQVYGILTVWSGLLRPKEARGIGCCLAIPAADRRWFWLDADGDPQYAGIGILKGAHDQPAAFVLAPPVGRGRPRSTWRTGLLDLALMAFHQLPGELRSRSSVPSAARCEALHCRPELSHGTSAPVVWRRRACSDPHGDQVVDLLSVLARRRVRVGQHDRSSDLQ